MKIIFLRVTLLALLTGWPTGLWAQDASAVPAAASAVPTAAAPAAPAPPPSIPLPANDLHAFWKTFATYQTMTAQFQSTLTDAQKALIARITALGREVADRAAALKKSCAGTLIGVDAAGLPVQTEDPACIAPPTAAPDAPAAPVARPTAQPATSTH